MTEINCPSIDVCAWCGDSECDGIGCIAGLDPEREEDREVIENLQDHIRAGAIFIAGNQALAEAEKRA